MKTRRSLPTVALCLGLSAYAIPSQLQSQPRKHTAYSVEGERLFAKGLEKYSAYDYNAARSHFEKLTGLTLNQRSSAGLLMLSKTLLRLGEIDPALQAAKRMEREFQGSRYASDARLVAGDCLYHLRRYYEAADRYGRLLATAAPLPLQASAAERLAGIVENGFITSQALDRISSQIGASRLRDALRFGKARWYGRLGWVEQSRAAMRAYVDGVSNGIFTALALESLRADTIEPKGPERDELGRRERPRSPRDSSAQSVRDRPRSESDGSLNGVVSRSDRRQRSLSGRPGTRKRPLLGAVMPLSGPERHFGRELLAGIRLANEDLGEPFEIVEEDTGLDYGDLPIFQSESSRLIRTVEAVERLVREWEVVAIIGPVFSSSCVAAAKVADAAGVPLIAPLAQQSGLDQLGQSVFQLSIIPETQGAALAEYATLVLGLETLVVMAPLSDYGWSFDQAFTVIAERNGGTVVHREWYVPVETKDFQHQFEAIRQVGFSLIPPTRADSAMFDSLSFAVLDGSTSGDEVFLEMLEAKGVEEPPDSSAIFIDSIDGIAVVVESFEDASTIVPQLRFHRLQTQILGNDIWNNPEAIRQLNSTDKDYIKGSIFVSGRSSSAATREFVDRFRNRFSRDPGYAAAGYDAARIVMSGWLDGHGSSRELREWLAGLREYEGVGGRISFADGRRSNNELTLLTIDSRGKVSPVSVQQLPEIYVPPEDLPKADLWDLPEDWDTNGAGDLEPVDRGLDDPAVGE